MSTQEHARLRQIRNDATGWRRWGPYVADRAWATVREDYSATGDAWNYLPHDLARSKAYRWGEDAIAGLCDRYQVLLLAPSFWNRKDVILKERLFGLSSPQGNHGEDVKEYYFYLENLPSHAYMKFLYKYPQAAFPYSQLVEENANRHGQGLEYELIDTGVFDDDRYFDIQVEYAKLDEEDIVLRIEAINRGPDPAPLEILPHLWFRNNWSWTDPTHPEPTIGMDASGPGFLSLVADDTPCVPLPKVPFAYKLNRRVLYAPANGSPLFTNNETNAAHVYGEGHISRSPYVKDAFHRHIIQGEPCVNPDLTGTKAAIRYTFDAIPSGESVTLRLRLSPHLGLDDPLGIVDSLIAERIAETEEFYESIQPSQASDDEKSIQRQAFAGLLWSKACYLYDVQIWLQGDRDDLPPPVSRQHIRNTRWRHLNSLRVMTMPDAWEYPWFAAWDLAFQAVTFAIIDPRFAMDQLWLLLFEQFQHPNGQIPACEWEFSDLNPPVHAWAVWRVYNMARIRLGEADFGFLERCLHKLLINFTWWINKVDNAGSNIFEGGFLGLDNITVVDRSAPSVDGAVLEQSDSTGWMGMFCLNLMRICLELAKKNPVYESLAIKFFQHYVYVAAAMKRMGNRDYQLWDEQDGFFYDVLRYPDGRFRKFRVRSLVGLIPLYAVERLEREWIEPFKEFSAAFDWFLKNRRDLVNEVVHTVEREGKITHVLTIVNHGQLDRILLRMWDPDEFLSPFGIRSLSKAHQNEPFELDGRRVGYEPAESQEKIKGGNSNWRGPIWFPTNFLLIESLRKLATAYGTDIGIRPGGPDQPLLTFMDMASDLAYRLIGIFTKDENGHRAVYGSTRKFQDDPLWKDLILFYEYFHGDEGAGLGASHQTGWTSLVASLLDEWRQPPFRE